MLIAFVPVLHKGYLELFAKHQGGELGILGADVIADYTALVRDLRVVDPVEMKKMIEALGIFGNVRILDKSELSTPSGSPITGGEPAPGVSIFMPDEEVSHDLAQKYFADKPVTFESIFLRWNRPISTTEHIIAPGRTISVDEMDRELMAQANDEAQKSADWWRQVGAVAVKDGVLIATGHNRHLPSDFHLGQNGDPRSSFDAGTHLDIYTSIHAEASIVADCARAGTQLNGASLFITTFPCPNCARLLCVAGIKKIYYQKGYSLLDAEDIFKAFNVDIVLVASS